MGESMKKIFLTVILCCFAFIPKNFAQDDIDDRNPPRMSMEKIEQLEKAKLIEALDLDEETAIRFFARRKNYREQERELFKKRDGMIKKIEDRIRNSQDIGEKESIDLLNEILAVDQKFVDDKEKFFKSLNDILSSEQILRLAVFDNKFMREIRNILIRRPRGNRG